MTQHVAVLYGGLSSERDVSLSSGEGVCEALSELGYKVTPVDVDRNLASTLKEVQPDVAFNALHGQYGEDGCVPGLLEIMDIPYTHSGLLASAAAMNKVFAKNVFQSVGIQTPNGKVISREEALAQGANEQPLMNVPHVIKPIDEGSSLGVKIASHENPVYFNEGNWEYKDEVLVEEFIDGKELSVAVIGEGDEVKALGVIEIAPKIKFYDYKTKYTDGMADHIMPAPVDEAIYTKAMQVAEQAHKALECRGVSRVDIRYNPEEKEQGLYVLELNTHPGLTPLSLVPEIAQHVGINFGQLLDLLIQQARCDKWSERQNEKRNRAKA